MDPHNGKLIYEHSGACGFLVARTPSCEVVRLELAYGATIPEHALDMPVLFLVQAGHPTLIAEGVPSDVSAGAVREMAPGAARGWTNSHPNTAIITVVKLIQP